MLHHVSSPPSQLEELKQQLELQEEELGRLRLGVVRLLGAGPGADSRERAPRLSGES